jgi:hypothetical protein
VKWKSRGLAATAALVIPGGVVLVGGAVFARLYAAARTGRATLDRFGIRGRVVAYGILVFGAGLTRDHVRALMAIVRYESDGKPENYVHDLTARGGPGVGPMAVNRTTAKELGLWEPPEGATDEDERAAFLQLAADEGLGIAWGVKVFKHKLHRAGGDLAEAIRRYNGAGDAAESYRARALAFALDTWGVELGEAA